MSPSARLSFAIRESYAGVAFGYSSFAESPPLLLSWLEPAEKVTLPFETENGVKKG